MPAGETAHPVTVKFLVKLALADVLMNSKDKKETKTMTGYVGAIEKETLENTYFRQVLFTAQHTQLVVMCLRPGEEIGNEVHPNVDQFFRIEQVEAKFVFNEKEERPVHDGDAAWFRQGRKTTQLIRRRQRC